MQGSFFVARKETKRPAKRDIWFQPSVHEIKTEVAKRRRMPKADGFYEWSGLEKEIYQIVANPWKFLRILPIDYLEICYKIESEKILLGFY